MIHSNYTENIDNEIIGFFRVDYNDNYRHYMEAYNKERQTLFDNNGSNPNIITSDEIWMSCEPWFEINSIVPPYNKDNTIPQFIWDKFKEKDGRITTNLMVMIHHGFMDGYQIGAFYKKLEDNINSIEGDV